MKFRSYVKKWSSMSMSTGQSAIEFVFVVPVLFLLLLWTFQFFYAIHTSNVNQKYAREELMKQINHHRDLRNSSAPGVAQYDFENDGYFLSERMPHMEKDIYRNRFSNGKTFFAVSVTGTPEGSDVPQRIVGEPKVNEKGEMDQKNILKVYTTVGICRDEECK
ncbi:MAG: pilus assembly protein [Deltaproteobacteria bacterium]|nr:pilus assembly protein [Deltaproteobacteria bacterium]